MRRCNYVGGVSLGHVGYGSLRAGHGLRLSGQAGAGGGRRSRDSGLLLTEQSGGGADPGPHSEAGQGRYLLPRPVVGAAGDTGVYTFVPRMKLFLSVGTVPP